MINKTLRNLTLISSIFFANYSFALFKDNYQQHLIYQSDESIKSEVALSVLKNDERSKSLEMIAKDLIPASESYFKDTYILKNPLPYSCEHGSCIGELRLNIEGYSCKYDNGFAVVQVSDQVVIKLRQQNGMKNKVTLSKCVKN